MFVTKKQQQKSKPLLMYYFLHSSSGKMIFERGGANLTCGGKNSLIFGDI
jgi:hypothetical protein